MFAAMMAEMVRYYEKKHKIRWKWQAADGKSYPAPLGVRRPVRIPRTMPNLVANFTCWLIGAAPHWVAKRIRTRWCKKADNWLALLQFACADILFHIYDSDVGMFRAVVFTFIWAKGVMPFSLSISFELHMVAGSRVRLDRSNTINYK